MLKNKKVLLVEDDHFTRFMMKDIFDVLCIDVDVAKNGREACDYLDKTPNIYGLVLMDIHMPEMSGIDATQEIRSSPNDPPRNIAIIAVTADEHYHHADIVERHGLDGYMSKPITAGGLKGLVDRYCAVI